LRLANHSLHFHPQILAFLLGFDHVL
jgi:hypothetical protein